MAENIIKPNVKSEDLLAFIKSRKSVRNFIFVKINDQTIREILECGRWAPSGMNNQPWKITVVKYPTVKQMLANLTKHGGLIESSYVSIVVFLNLQASYHRVKDIQAIGAFMENILLGVHAMGLGAVWIGEILNKKEEVNELFKLDPDKYELMGVIAIGVIDELKEKMKEEPRVRKMVDEFTDWL
ncbi:MAG: nitroreductase family protein [Promethearchaeota archaeon]